MSIQENPLLNLADYTRDVAVANRAQRQVKNEQQQITDKRKARLTNINRRIHALTAQHAVNDKPVVFTHPLAYDHNSNHGASWEDIAYTCPRIATFEGKIPTSNSQDEVDMSVTIGTVRHRSSDQASSYMDIATTIGNDTIHNIYGIRTDGIASHGEEYSGRGYSSDNGIYPAHYFTDNQAPGAFWQEEQQSIMFRNAFVPTAELIQSTLTAIEQGQLKPVPQTGK